MKERKGYPLYPDFTLNLLILVLLVLGALLTLAVILAPTIRGEADPFIPLLSRNGTSSGCTRSSITSIQVGEGYWSSPSPPSSSPSPSSTRGRSGRGGGGFSPSAWASSSSVSSSSSRWWAT